MQNDELKALLRGTGREIAIDQMAAACTTASDSTTMKNQLDVLYYAAVHVIATRVYNGVRQDKLNAKKLMQMVFRELERELHVLVDLPEEDMELETPGGEA